MKQTKFTTTINHKGTAEWREQTAAKSNTAKRNIEIGQIIRQRHPDLDAGQVMKMARRFNRMFA
jgi:hypothetical protein